MRRGITANLSCTDTFIEIMTELRTVVTSMQRPKLQDARWIKSMRKQARNLERQITAMKASFGELHRSFEERWDSIAAELKAYSAELTRSANKRELLRVQKRLSEQYEELLVQVKKFKVAGVETFTRAHHLKPVNYPRSLFHATLGVVGVLSYQYILSYWQALGILITLGVVFGTLELTRRMSGRWNNLLVDKVFGLIARPFERHKINSSSFYLLGLTIITAFCSKPAAQVAVLILAFADPAATIIGSLWGKRKLVGDKSLAGASAFFTVALLTSLLFIAFGPPNLPFWSAFGIASLLAAAGTTIELFSRKIDDNLTIPVVCGFIATLFI